MADGAQSANSAHATSFTSSTRGCFCQCTRSFDENASRNVCFRYCGIDGPLLARGQRRRARRRGFGRAVLVRPGGVDPVVGAVDDGFGIGIPPFEHGVPRHALRLARGIGPLRRRVGLRREQQGARGNRNQASRHHHHRVAGWSLGHSNARRAGPSREGPAPRQSARRGAVYSADIAVMAATLTISATVMPCWSTFTGLRTPSRMGPRASAPPRRCTSL